MTFPGLLLLVCLATALPWFPAAQAAGNDPMEEALKRAGLARQLEHLDKIILSALPEDTFPDQKTRRQAETLLQKEAAGPELMQIVLRAVREDSDPKAIEEVLGFYKTPLGVKAGQIAGTALLPGTLREIKESRGLVAGLKDVRIKLLKRILAADRVVELNGILLTEAVEGLVDGAEFENSPGAGREDALHKRMVAIDAAIRSEKERTTQLALMASAYTLRSLTDAELGMLAQHGESDAAQRFRRAFHEGLRQAVYHTANTLGRFIGKRQRDLEKGSSSPGGSSPAGPE